MHSDYAANATNRWDGDVRTSAGQGVSNLPLPSVTAGTLSALDTIEMVLSDAAGSLRQMEDRLFGAEPAAINNAGDPGKPLAVADEIAARLRNVIEVAAAVRDRANALNARI